MRKKIYRARFEIRMPPEMQREGVKLAVSRDLTLSQLLRDLLSRELKDARREVSR